MRYPHLGPATCKTISKPINFGYNGNIDIAQCSYMLLLFCVPRRLEPKVRESGNIYLLTVKINNKHKKCNSLKCDKITKVYRRKAREVAHTFTLWSLQMTRGWSKEVVECIVKWRRGCSAWPRSCCLAVPAILGWLEAGLIIDRARHDARQDEPSVSAAIFKLQTAWNKPWLVY